MNLFRTLKDLGYKFENSELRRIDSNEKYKFEDDCRDGYEKLCEAVISYVQEKLLMDTLKMRRIYLPDDSSAFVFGTKMVRGRSRLAYGHANQPLKNQSLVAHRYHTLNMPRNPGTMF